MQKVRSLAFTKSIRTAYKITIYLLTSRLLPIAYVSYLVFEEGSPFKQFINHFT